MTLQIVVSGACDSGQSSELKGQSVSWLELPIFLFFLRVTQFTPA